MNERCGKCKNCASLARVKASVSKNCGIHILGKDPRNVNNYTHVDDDIVQVWHDALKEFLCTGQGEKV